MNRILSWLKTIHLPLSSILLVLLVLCVLSYGLLIAQLGFYWDDLPILWISQKLGSSGLENYFSTNRPFWGILYQLTTPLLGPHPINWQIFAIFWRWLAGVFFWVVLRQTWPEYPKVAIWASIFFIVYPGFMQQPISLVYSHFYIVLTIFLISLSINLAVVRKSIMGVPIKWDWLVTIIALGLSFINLISMEYFFFLEIIRPVLIWNTINIEHLQMRKRIRLTLKYWLPYLMLFVMVLTWRLFFFSYQTQNYQLIIYEQLKEKPLSALVELAGSILSSIWTVLVSAWFPVFQLPLLSESGKITALFYYFLVFLILIFGLGYLLLITRSSPDRIKKAGWSGKAIIAGSLACLVAGIPIWLIDMQPGLIFPNDRFSLPFIFGVCLIYAGVLDLIPIKYVYKLVIICILSSLAVGFHFLKANEYRRDWETTQRFFWQLNWRVPGLKPGTAILANEMPLKYYSDNSLTALLNWHLETGTPDDPMDYMLLYPSRRLGSSILKLVKGMPIEINYLASNFSGNTEQIVAIYYDPPACLRVLDPDLDVDNKMLPQEMQAAALLSTNERILTEVHIPLLDVPNVIAGPEPPHAWCYYYEMADLARQQNDWQKVADLGDIAFDLGDYPNDPSERIPFIEAYAHVGRWQRALELSMESQKITPMMEPVLCNLWRRILIESPASQEKDTTIDEAYAALSCGT